MLFLVVVFRSVQGVPFLGVASCSATYMWSGLIDRTCGANTLESR